MRAERRGRKPTWLSADAVLIDTSGPEDFDTRNVALVWISVQRQQHLPWQAAACSGEAANYVTSDARIVFDVLSYSTRSPTTDAMKDYAHTSFLRQVFYCVNKLLVK
ncbi:hypothetical protein GUJ93_ZPchr0005g14289 [Zizania palustris]|uniref:Uncharacterized protein n=1 Tax=Zizania palustris TaxID=103762 RepID=A0A8J5SQX9_ZIZPA|nr:hypothetical protein GUJ93_ZPchr0005g14289 [Zizania palustris]